MRNKIGDKNCSNCSYCNLELNFETEEAVRTCIISNADVALDNVCVNHKDKVVDYTRNMSIVDNCYEPFSIN